MIIAYFSHGLLSAAKLYLFGRIENAPDDALLHHGYAEGLTMLLLAAQTGLIELSSTQRAFLIGVILFIVLSSVLQSVYDMAEPVLIRLSASHNRRWLKHIRIVSLCLILFILPILMSSLLIKFLPVDFWLLVIVSSCTLTSIQIFGSLIIYFLYFVEMRFAEPWERLEDFIFYSRCAIKLVEFLISVFVIAYV